MLEETRFPTPICLHAAALVAAIATAGCSTTATIHQRNGREIETTLVGSDREHIYFKTASGASRVAKKDVTDIDHPGDLDILFGLLIMSYGALNIAAGQDYCRREGTAACVGVYTPLSVGVLMTGFGLMTYSSSTSALDRKVRVSPRPGTDPGRDHASSLP